MLDAGVVNNRAELARRMGVSRARVTQLLNLLKLSAEIRHGILGLPGDQRRVFTDRKLRQIVKLRSRLAQVKAIHRLEGAYANREKTGP
jgi:hypothetical protein